MIAFALPYVGFVSWHLLERSPLQNNLKSYFSDIEKREDTVEIGEFVEKMRVDVRHNASRLVNIDNFVGPTRKLGDEERKLRPFQWISTGQLDKNGIVIKKLVVRETTKTPPSKNDSR